MATPKFTHLHCHTHYSLLDGLGQIPHVVAATKERGMDAIAITDHGNMYGVIEFYQEATKAGIKPIIGEEMYLAPEDHTLKRGKIDANPFHITMLAYNNVGYKNLIKLTTKAHLEGFYYKPRIDLKLLEEYNEGLIALSGCLGGMIAEAVLRKSEAEAKATIQNFMRIFDNGRFYLEVQHHPTEPEQMTLNNALFRLGKELGAKPVATADFHYISREDADEHDILLCIQTNKTVDEKDRMDLRQLDLSLKPPEQMAEEFQDHPEALASTQEIADRCNVEIQLGKTILPTYELPENVTAEQHLRELCVRGIAERYKLPVPEGIAYPEGTPQNVIDRLEYELGVINQTGFSSYFLIVQDFVNYAKGIGIQVGPGRGSAAGSLVAYLLKITNVDPLAYDLLFERFLNPERISMPDIDLDFADDRRAEVLAYVEKKYGRDHVAQIITFGTLAARMAVRDSGRALGFPYAYPDKISKMIPMFRSLSEALEEVPEMKQMYNNEIDAKRIIDAAKKLEGVARHASVHACGVVISKEPLTEYLPLQLGEKKGSKNEQGIVTQYSLHPVEDIGLLKIDFLGLKNLTIIQNTLNIIRRTKGVDIKLDDLTFDDPASYKLFQEGHTTGVFQFESQGMKRYLKQLKPTELEDLIAMVALYRPGPMEQIPAYIDNKKNPDRVAYVHPKLEPILRKTNGVGIYQEQIMQIARDLAGFTLGEADVLRKAMGKKIKELLAEQREKFVTGCLNNGVDKATATKIFEFIEPFAGYGFNRSHAACYAIVGYQTAYLKANYPAEFMAALLTSDKHDTDRIAIEVEETRQMGINVLSPDVNTSFADFTVVPDPEDASHEAIRFGLSAIKNVGEHIISEIIKEREANGVFTDLTDFLFRIVSKDVNRKSLESLAKSGAFDALEERQCILDNMETLLAYSKRVRESALSKQTDIFATLSAGTSLRPQLNLKRGTTATKQQRLAWERELMGLYISEHPMADYREILAGKILTMKEISLLTGDADVRICGIITKVQKVWTRQQRAMLFITVEDTTSPMEVLIFPKVLDENPDLWVEGTIVIIEGKRSDKDGMPKVLANTGRRYTEDYIKFLKPLEQAQLPRQGANDAPVLPPNNLLINLTTSSSPEHLQTLKEFLVQNHGGKTKIFLAMPSSGKTKRIETKYAVTYSTEFIERLEGIVGSGMITYN